MIIIEYKRDPQDQPHSYHPKTIPSFVTDGGYFENPDNHLLIGVGLDGSIPDYVSTFTLAELQTRQRAVHAKYPMTVNGEPDANELTDDEVNSRVKDWVDARS